MHDDSADELLQRVLNGDQAALELWSQTRAWVISGQRKTLARLGIAFDRVFFESDFLPEVAELTELGLQEGTLEKRRRRHGDLHDRPRGAGGNAAGALRRRADPAHARARLLDGGTGLDGTTSIQVCGQEWVAHVTCRRQLMAELVHTGERQRLPPLPRHLPRHGRQRTREDRLEQEGRAPDRPPGRVDRRAARGRAAARARCGAGTPPPTGSPRRSRSASSSCTRATKRVDFEPEKLLADEQGARLGPGAGARATNGRRLRRHADGARRARAGPRLPLRGRPGGDLRAPAGAGGARASTSARWPATPPTWRAGSRSGAGAARRAGRALDPRPQRPRPRPGGAGMRTLLVDNHDSYTYNVFHLLAGVSGEEPIVVDNDAVSWRALSRWDFDAIVLSPGPGSPQRWHDFCVCNDILRYSEIPVLGICLGHQGLGHAARRQGLERAGGDARAAQPHPPRRRRPLRGHPAGLPGRPLPLAGDHRHGPRRQRHRLGRRRRRDGDRTPPPADVGRPVPPRVDRHRARRQAGRELLRAGPPAQVAALARRQAAAAGAAAQPGAARPRAAARASCGCARSPASPRPRRSSNGSSATPSTPSGSTAPTRRRGSRSAPSSAPAPAPTAACSSTTSSPGPRPGTAPAARAASAPRSSTCSTASSPGTRSSHPRRPAARADGRLRRLSRLRAEGGLRLAERAPVRHARRSDDARQPPRRRRPRA